MFFHKYVINVIYKMKYFAMTQRISVLCAPKLNFTLSDVIDWYYVCQININDKNKIKGFQLFFLRNVNKKEIFSVKLLTKINI